MKNSQTKIDYFISLRANHASFRVCARMLGIAKSTCQEWAKIHSEEIKAVRSDETRDFNYFHRFKTAIETENIEELRRQFMHRLLNDPYGFSKLPYKDAARLYLAMNRELANQLTAPPFKDSPFSLKFQGFPDLLWEERRRAKAAAAAAAQETGTISTPGTPAGTPQPSENPAISPQNVENPPQPAHHEKSPVVPDVKTSDIGSSLPSTEERMAILRNMELLAAPLRKRLTETYMQRANMYIPPPSMGSLHES